MSATADLYDLDFYAWAQQQAALLRAGALHGVDIEHVAEELESMGKSQKRALGSRLTVLLAHLLKWRHQPGARSPGWRNSIAIQRIELQELLEENPSLRPTLPTILPSAYRKARLWAATETQLNLTAFPTVCPFELEQALSEEFWPE